MLNTRRLAFILVTILFFVVFEKNACAEQRITKNAHERNNSDFSFTLGALGMHMPEYDGSDDYKSQALPFFDITWREYLFFNSTRGLGGYIWNRQGVKVGASLGYNFGRDEDDSSDLHGLGDIEDGAVANIFFEWPCNALTFDARYTQQITGQDTGFQLHLGLGHRWHITDALMIKSHLTTTFANEEYMETYFGVTDSQSASSGLPFYEADAGVKSCGLQIVALFEIDRHWGIQVMAGYDRLFCKAADSPIVKDEDQYRAGAGLSYRF